MFKEKYKKKKWRIRKEGVHFYIQYSRFGIFWENKKYRQYGVTPSSTILYLSVENAKSEALRFAQEDEDMFHFRRQLKESDRQDKKFVIDLGRLP